MSRAFDVAIVGLGAMGSATAYHVGRRGLRVLGLDRFAPPHALGSSHGETRIIREAYFEDPRYVPLVQRAYVLWRELEVAAGEKLMVETGGLMIGPEDGTLVRGATASAETHGLPYERLSADRIRQRFPALRPRDDMVAVWEPRAGTLFPEACVRSHLALAAAAGAELRSDEAVTGWRAAGGGFEIRTRGSTHRAARLILAANAWLDRMLPEPGLGLTVTRQPLFWFEPRAAAEQFEPGRFPVYICEPEPGRFFYGFPAFHGEVKVAPHLEGAVTDPDALDRQVRAEEVEAMRQRLADYLPDANGRFVRSVACMYANTADGHFVIDSPPAHPGVLVLSACSGHGFKFSSAIGEVAAEWAMERPSALDLGLFRWRA